MNASRPGVSMKILNASRVSSCVVGVRDASRVSPGVSMKILNPCCLLLCLCCLFVCVGRDCARICRSPGVGVNILNPSVSMKILNAVRQPMFCTLMRRRPARALTV